jgi:hypothetical protein
MGRTGKKYGVLTMGSFMMWGNLGFGEMGNIMNTGPAKISQRNYNMLPTTKMSLTNLK